MVARKPASEVAAVNDANNANNANNASSASNAEPPRIEVQSATDSEVDPEQIWGAQDQILAAPGEANGAESADRPRQVPDPLRPGAATTSSLYEQGEQNPWDDSGQGVEMPIREGAPTSLEEVPNALRPGVARSETNPFKRKPLRGSPEAVDSTQRSPNEPAVMSGPSAKAVPLPQYHASPDHNTNPWQPALEGSKMDHAQPPLSLLDQDPSENVWGSEPQLNTVSPGLAHAPSTADLQPALTSSLAPLNPAGITRPLGDEHAWEGEESNRKGKQPAESSSEIPPETIDGWNLVDHEYTSDPAPGNLSKQSTWENFVDVADDTEKEVVTRETEEAPALPPRTSAEVSPQPPPRQSPASNVNMSETYQIKNINWHDSKAAKNPRKSPILVQNANGPCPLVALVNALTLTTPADQANTNLVETLGSREQISLSFLLEVVVDELMSSRHTESDEPLPDMSELYGFLQGLHTGMNVNPRFIPAAETVAAHNQQISMSHAHPPDGDGNIPGSFEKTRDMELYATFRIPLIHGWLPPKDDPVYGALERRASSYDDAQNLLFQEEELENKFSNSQMGLTEEEQQLYQDIVTIKSFLYTTATQLTPSGLDTVTKSIKPGEVAILFRNDHFSTLYRHPHTLQLFTLVTDAGYFSHDEVVWESLTDVRGEQAEFFSGDFRVVGGNGLQRAASSNEAWYGNSNASAASGGTGWQTVQNRRSRNNRQSEPAPPTAPLSPQHEQEDRDLALALQLQEEEEERHRAEQAARRRESRLSEQFIEQQGRDTDHTASRTRGGSVSSNSRGSSHSLPAPRGSSTQQPARGGAQARGGRPVQQQVRSLIPPRTHRPADDHLDDAPPSYEQAAKSSPYLPPTGHPSHPESSPRGNQAPRRSSVLRSQANAGPSTPTRPRQPAAPVAAGGTPGGAGKDKDCTMM
ncbi:hypothetical protein F4802DRAFT_66054 [Xylaria palmicola]|nr:hypothetical protein F4802DRAFT_66054 [Xylaria palmicola]